MIEINALTIRYGRAVAVDDLTFTVKPGKVTGFLGPNGAGKSSTMRAVLGLETPHGGTALIDGRPYTAYPRPLRQVGALLDAGAVHGGRSARAHVACVARSNGIGSRRVTEVLELAGLAGVGSKRIAGFSLGMKQRLGIAVALLGDPPVLMFDEPVNGLDPEGVRWIRELMRAQAAEGRTVLVSSHLMGEMAVTADHVVVVGRGRLIADTTMTALVERFQRGVLVRAAEPERLARALRAAGATVARENDALDVAELDPARIGEVALAQGIALRELTPRGASLEEAFMELTEGSVEFR
ncbi:ATP-binding cassette domain-containing protein [Nonomuraea africana]|uniref:ABC-2 type transport system ATP-binding protein n=1 Tax=Nonomuraea africana TaxID=46171 RepID=A0ABR9KTS2_9ACTN|nr:ATP-binding cassette domain-containing protein [Nonomuraea africana]MBE1565140.1 ABC-2 type transport system ATP-binding protein [Nonomuraea africana]